MDAALPTDPPSPLDIIVKRPIISGSSIGSGVVGGGGVVVVGAGVTGRGRFRRLPARERSRVFGLAGDGVVDGKDAPPNPTSAEAPPALEPPVPPKPKKSKVAGLNP